MTPTPTPPCLGEREAVARKQIQDRIIAAFGQAAWTGDKGISAHGGKIAMSHDGWKAIRPLLDEAIQPLRTENETLRAERDAAAKEVTSALGQLRHLYQIVRRMNEELADGLLAPEIRSLEKLHRALTTLEPPHGD